MRSIILRSTPVIVSLGVLWMFFAGAQSSAGTPKTVLYKDPARTFFEKFSTDSWEGGNLVPKKPLKSQKDDILFDETTGVRLHDCSNATYRCLFGSSRVFALPRIGYRQTRPTWLGDLFLRWKNAFAVTRGYVRQP